MRTPAGTLGSRLRAAADAALAAAAPLGPAGAPADLAAGSANAQRHDAPAAGVLKPPPAAAPLEADAAMLSAPATAHASAQAGRQAVAQGRKSVGRVSPSATGRFEQARGGKGDELPPTCAPKLVAANRDSQDKPQEVHGEAWAGTEGGGEGVAGTQRIPPEAEVDEDLELGLQVRLCAGLYVGVCAPCKPCTSGL